MKYQPNQKLTNNNNQTETIAEIPKVNQKRTKQLK